MVEQIKNRMRRLLRKENGQGMIEYAIIVAVVVAAVVVFSNAIGSSQKSAGNTVGTQITNAVANP